MSSIRNEIEGDTFYLVMGSWVGLCFRMSNLVSAPTGMDMAAGCSSGTDLYAQAL